MSRCGMIKKRCTELRKTCRAGTRNSEEIKRSMRGLDGHLAKSKTCLTISRVELTSKKRSWRQTTSVTEMNSRDFNSQNRSESPSHCFPNGPRLDSLSHFISHVGRSTASRIELLVGGGPCRSGIVRSPFRLGMRSQPS